MIGADDMAFPTLNMLSYWFMWPAFIVMTTAFFVEGGGPAAGWTSYPPLSVLRDAAPGSHHGQTLWLLGITFVGVSSMMGSINLTVSTCTRPPINGAKAIRTSTALMLAKFGA